MLRPKLLAHIENLRAEYTFFKIKLKGEEDMDEKLRILEVMDEIATEIQGYLN